MARNNTARNAGAAVKVGGHADTADVVVIGAPESSLTAEQVAVVHPTDEELRASGFASLSARIRELTRLGVSTGDISRIVRRENGEHPRYQHVRNVQLTPLKRTAS